MRALLWLGVLINVGSFMGPLWPALVQRQLGGGSVDYGLLEATGVAGGMLGGLLAGSIERRLGAGRTVALGWSVAGACFVGIAVSSYLPATMILEIIDSFGLYAAGIASGAIMIVSVPEEYRGRVFGIVRGLGVVLIPVSALAGGWIGGVRRDIDHCTPRADSSRSLGDSGVGEFKPTDRAGLEGHSMLIIKALRM